MSRRTLSEMRHAVARHVSARRTSDGRRRVPERVRPAAIPARHVELLDWVELREPFDQWPAGTLAAVVDIEGDRALVEVANEQGRSLDLFSISLDSLQVSQDRS